MRQGQPNECWPWRTGTRGQFVYRDESGARVHVLAYRLICALVNGPVTDGQVVKHLCNNPACCNPNHLEACSQASNIQDAIRDGLRRYDSPHYLATRQSAGRAVKNRARGERNYMARVSDAVVAQVRERVSNGERQVDVARDLGLSKIFVYRVVHRYTRG